VLNFPAVKNQGAVAFKPQCMQPKSAAWPRHVSLRSCAWRRAGHRAGFKKQNVYFHSVPTMKKPFLATTLTAVALLTACEPTRCYNRLQVAPFAGAGPKKPYGTVEAFQTAADVKRPFKVVGLMTCEGSAEEEGQIVKAMLYRAADLGADGVLLTVPNGIGGDATPQTQKVDVRLGWAALLGGGNNRSYRAEAIRFTDEPTQAAVVTH